MKVLVTFALETEFAPWRRLRKFRPGKWGGKPAHWTEIAGAEVGVVVTGAGPENAASAACSVMCGDDIDVCISAGLAGALLPEHLPGEILAARSICSERLGVPYRRDSAESDAVLLLIAEECGAKVVDRFYTASHVALTADEKGRLGALADAVEMESFEVLTEAPTWGIRAVAIRAVIDGVGEDLPVDFNRVLTEQGDVSIPRILGEVLRSPQSLPALVRFGQRSRRAADALAKFLDNYLRILVQQLNQVETQSPVAAT